MMPHEDLRYSGLQKNYPKKPRHLVVRGLVNTMGVRKSARVFLKSCPICQDTSGCLLAQSVADGELEKIVRREQFLQLEARLEIERFKR